MDNSKMSCLVVEDHLDTLRLIVKLLNRFGYRAIGAASYREAVDAFEASPCDVLVCDITLHDGSGLDLMRKLAPHGVRGIAVSGWAARADLKASRDAGFSSHLTKPISIFQLLEALRELPAE
jgi:CheY-like chemotaxis protein